MFLAISNQNSSDRVNNYIKCGLFSACANGIINTGISIKNYIKLKPFPKDIYIKESVKAIAKSSAKSAIYTVILCGLFDIFNKMINKMSNKNK